MFNEKILKVAKKLLDKKNIEWVSGSMHYKIDENLLLITDSFVLAEIEMPKKYKQRFENQEVKEITIDYYTACWLLAMLEHKDAVWEISEISTWKAMVQDFVEYELQDMTSKKHGTKIRIPVIDAQKIPQYKELSLFNWKEDSVKEIQFTSEFEKFQEVSGLLLGSWDIPVAKVSNETYTIEWTITDYLWEALNFRVCVMRAQEL